MKVAIVLLVLVGLAYCNPYPKMDEDKKKLDDGLMRRSDLDDEDERRFRDDDESCERPDLERRSYERDFYDDDDDKRGPVSRDYSKFQRKFYSSCKDIYEKFPKTPSGYYWLSSGPDKVRRVYCDMCTPRCGVYGWEKLYKLDFKEKNTTKCPGGFKKDSYTDKMKNYSVCKFQDDKAYRFTSAKFDVEDSKYYEVCAMVSGFQKGTPTGFYPYCEDDSKNYVDGLVFSHGKDLRHFWTYAVGAYVRHPDMDKDEKLRKKTCPDFSPKYRSHLPYFMGNDFYCDSGFPLYNKANETKMHMNRLWEVEDCKPGQHWCYRADQPWFYKKMAKPIEKYVEMRSYINKRDTNDVLFDKLAIYVR